MHRIDCCCLRWARKDTLIVKIVWRYVLLIRRAPTEEDSLWQALVSRTYRFYRANTKQQRWKNFYRDTPAMLPRPSPLALAKATSARRLFTCV